MKFQVIEKQREKLYKANLALWNEEFHKFNQTGDAAIIDRIFQLDKERWYIRHCSGWEVIKASSKRKA